MEVKPMYNRLEAWVICF